MIITILEFKAFQSNQVKIKSHKYINGKWIKNDKFDLYLKSIEQTPSRFLWTKKYKKEVKEEDEK